MARNRTQRNQVKAQRNTARAERKAQRADTKAQTQAWIDWCLNWAIILDGVSQDEYTWALQWADWLQNRATLAEIADQIVIWQQWLIDHKQTIDNPVLLPVQNAGAQLRLIA